MSLARTVITGAGIVTAAGVFSRLLSLLTAPILSRLLGPEPYGVAALVGNTVAMACTLALLGIDQAYARYFLQEGIESRAEVERFCWRFAATGAIVAALASTAVWLLFGEHWVGSGQVSVALYLPPAIMLSVGAAMATARVRLAGNYALLGRSIALGAVSAAVVSIAAALLGQRNAWTLLEGTIAGSITTLVMLGVPAVRTLVRRSTFEPARRRELVLLGASASVTAPMHWVISSADRWFLANHADAAAVGIYSMITNVAMTGLMLNSSLTLTWFPEASRIYAANSTDALAPLGRLWERLVVALGLVWVGVSAAAGDIVRLLTAPEFHVGAPYAPWLAGGAFFYGLATMATTAFFLCGRMRDVAWVWLICAAASLLLNRILIPTFGPYGAAAAQCASFALVAFCLLWLSQRILPLPIHAVRLAACLAFTLLLGIVFSVPWAQSPSWSLVFKVPTVLAASAIAVRVAAPDWYRLGLTKARSLAARLRAG